MDQIEELIRKYLSTGIAVVVLLVAPGTEIDESALPPGSRVVTVEPARPGQAPTTHPTPAPGRGGETGDSGERTGAGGTDPGAPGPSSDPGSDESGSEPSAGPDPRPSPAPESDSGEVTSSGGPSSSASGSDATTAAETHGWGTPERADDFDSGTDGWSIYDGPGHGGQGRRSPSAVATTGGVLTITGDASGTTAGMAWNPGRLYGRWEGRVKAPVGDPSYNALLLLWPDAEDWPSGGELDFMEMSDPERRVTDMFLHYGADNQQLNGKVQVDATQWHNWAVEWTPDAITAYLDGKEWFRTTDRSTFPPGPMHLCIQLDWFPQGTGAKVATMQVDWVRQYRVPGGGPQAGAGAGPPGGQPGRQSDGDPGDESDRSSGLRNILRRMFSWA